VTGLRLKALHLATSPDFTYSKSYLGLLSALGSMLGIILCSVPTLSSVIRARQGANSTGHNTKTDASETPEPVNIIHTGPEQAEQLESRRAEWIV
jgi:hypothetical protein